MLYAWIISGAVVGATNGNTRKYGLVFQNNFFGVNLLWISLKKNQCAFRTFLPISASNVCHRRFDISRNLLNKTLKNEILNDFTKTIKSGSEADVSSVSPSSEPFVGALHPSIRSDEGLTLETSASESLYGGQFTLST